MRERPDRPRGVLSHAYGANADPLAQTVRPFSSKVVMITPGFVLRRLSHLPFHPGTR
ncbi:hypothetical protein [Nonomuraea sp. SYSU D8015]|uniref:hypothetical protein n=1 Tax=Nonomuraea sp. SYSU D8015 TaxID=2593644 RepID=UPI0016609A43|nr:hypothetical protein [Nonomuraea sp. SYSU D8015]